MNDQVYKKSIPRTVSKGLPHSVKVNLNGFVSVSTHPDFIYNGEKRNF